MQNFYADRGVRYLRRLAILQMIFFFLVLCCTVLWIAYQIGSPPGTPWMIEVVACLLAASLAAWVVQLLYAIPDWYSAWPRRTQQMIMLVTAGAAASSLLFYFFPHTFYWEVLEDSPIVVASVFACAGSALHLYRVLRNHRLDKVHLGVAEQKLNELRARSGVDAVARIARSHALEAGSTVGNPLPGPRGYVIAGLTSKPWYDSSEFEWVQVLEQSYDVIRQELEAILADNTPLSSYKYLGAEQGWKAIRFSERCSAHEDGFRLAPKTAELLKSIPHFPHFRDAMFSILKPGTILPPHRDNSNIFLTCHLGIKVPRGCGIRVAGETRGWDEGKCIVFDSSYEHDAWNTSDDLRAVLLIDFFHPELTDVEVEWVVARETGFAAQGV